LHPYILCEKNIYILALEMASPGNQHCASCIGTLLFSNVRAFRVLMDRILVKFESEKFVKNCSYGTPEK